MASPRFYTPVDCRVGAVVELDPAAAHHAGRVLRMRSGDRAVVFPGNGREYEGVIDLAGGRARVAIETESAPERESPLAVTLLQALVAADKLEWILEKATEAGAARVVLFPAERSVARLAADRAEKKLARWRQTAISACEQCGRNVVPEIVCARNLREALAAGAACGLAAILTPSARQAPSLAGLASVAFAVGPEGGFTDAEVAAAESLGYRPMLLGPRVLRTETAGLVACAAAQYASGDYATR